MSELHAPLVVETDLFDHREVKLHFINPCCFGEDFATWLRGELAASDLGLEFSPPIQEDYGWGFWGARDNDRIWVAISYMGEGPQEEPAQWCISADTRGLGLLARLFRKSDKQTLGALHGRIRRVLASNAAIKMIED